MKNENPTQPKLQNLVQEYYDDNGLSDSTLLRLMNEPRPSTRTVRRWLIAGTVAATFAALGFSVGILGRSTPPIDVATVATPKLVAVQIHADWCVRSPEVAPIFSELLTQYGNEPILFVTLDITDDVRREQAHLLSATLGIPQALDEPFESGMIKLIDRENHLLLAAITGREQADELEVQIAEALELVNDDRRETDAGGA